MIYNTIITHFIIAMASYANMPYIVQEGRELVKQNPVGSSWIEKIDCSKYASQIMIK